MRVLITGITGFLGQNLIEYFSDYEQFQLFGFSRNLSAARERLANRSITFLSDLDTKTLDDNQIDVVIHLAGIAHDLSGSYEARDYDNVNYEQTKVLYDHFSKSSASTFVFVSSVKAVTDHAPDQIDETFEPNPKTPYGISKLKAEQYLNANPIDGKEVYILRPCMVHGPGNKGNLNLLYKFVKSGMPYPLGRYRNQRSFLSVDNFSFVIHNILDGNLPGGTYMLADTESLSTTDLVRLIYSALGRKIRIINIPKRVIGAIAGIGSLFHLPINKDTISKLTDSQVVSNKKLLLNLKQDLPVEADEGILKTIKSIDE
jgi:nucleoside-diphosphate-sugar epimerase